MPTAHPSAPHGWSALYRPDHTPEDVRAALVADLLSRTASLMTSCLACLAVGLCAWYRTRGAWAAAWLVGFLACSLVRFWQIGLYRRHQAEGTLGGPDRWAYHYTVAGIASQVLMGLGCVACLRSADPILQLLSVMVVTGIAGSLASRNAGLPRLAIVQICASLVPTALLAVPSTGDPWLLGVTVGMVLYLFILCGTVLRNHREMMLLTMTERENARLLRRFKYLAQHDPLTALANRTQLLEQLRLAVARAQQAPPRFRPAPARRGPSPAGIAVLYLDLDGFKGVNDTLGHSAGDALLCAVGDRLRHGVRPDDVVARLGGDEFAILRGGTDRADAGALAARLVAAIAAPYDLGNGRDVAISASIGVSLLPDHATEADLLLQRADMALYVVKSGSRKGAFRFFDQTMEDHAQARRVLEAELQDALATGRGLVLFYQPIVHFETGEIIAREALVRWHHPRRGLLSPIEFVPLAEETGLVLPLGEWVLRTACADAARWRDGARVSVNVSPVQLGRGNRLPELVQDVLRLSGLAPARLELEVTETALLHHDSETFAQLQRIRGFGASIALDDFGTGFSSLAHLRNFAFDRIKIDGSFVGDATLRPHCAAIVRAVADLGARLGAGTVAEGIETEAQLALVRAEGCTEGQGFLFGRPHPGTDIPLNEARLAAVR